MTAELLPRKAEEEHRDVSPMSKWTDTENTATVSSMTPSRDRVSSLVFTIRPLLIPFIGAFIGWSAHVSSFPRESSVFLFSQRSCEDRFARLFTSKQVAFPQVFPPHVPFHFRVRCLLHIAVVGTCAVGRKFPFLRKCNPSSFLLLGSAGSFRMSP